LALVGWRAAGGHGAGDEPSPGFGPPRHWAGHEWATQDEAGRDARPAGFAPGADGTPRDRRLAGFAAGGDWDAHPPSAALAQVLESVSGAGWRCPGATDDEMVGVVRRWAAIESWAGAAKLGAIRELIHREDRPWLPTDQHVDQPDPWSESLTHELALALAASVGATDRTEWLAWELGTRLPGIDALLTDGTLTYGKAKAVAEAFQHLSDGDAAHAESLVLGRLAGKTYRQVLQLATAAASKADPGGDERRRRDAEKRAARVRLWREQSGAAALAGFDLPTDEALAAHANVAARAEQYLASGAFPDEKLDQLRAMSYLDLLNGLTPEARIANARAQASTADSADSAATPDTRAAAPDRDPDDDGAGGGGQGDGGSPGGPPGGFSDSGSAGGGQGNGGPHDGGGSCDSGDGGGGSSNGGSGGSGSGLDGDGGGGSSRGAGGGNGSSGNGGGSADSSGGPYRSQRADTPRTDLVIPLVTLLGRGNRPGESHQFGSLDPTLCRGLAALAADSPATRFCVTVTDQDGMAIGHGCARPPRRPNPARPDQRPALAALPARVNLTIPLTDLKDLADSGNADPASRGSPWALTPHADTPGPPGGYSTWTLATPAGREYTVRLETVPTFECDHARESHAYQPNDALRHLVQVRDGDCTFPPCGRHARESDLEHAVPYEKGGRTCACNAGARSRRCHRIKQSSGWDVTQPRPGFHQWTTPTGRTYVQEPKHYPS
jgi:hypothetical protein